MFIFKRRVNEMLNDRGSIKWTAMMLPEHLVEIKKWKQEQFQDKKRELTEWELEEIEKIIQQSWKLGKLVKLMIWNHNKLHELVGIVTGVDMYKKEILFETDLSIKRIIFRQIQKASLVDMND